MNITIEQLNKWLTGTGFRVARPESCTMIALYDENSPIGSQILMLSASLEYVLERILELCTLVRKAD